MNPVKSSPEVESQRTLARKKEVGEWALRLSATGRTYTDEENFIGRTLLAEEGFDKFDNPEPPYMDRYISLVIEDEDPMG